MPREAAPAANDKKKVGIIVGVIVLALAWIAYTSGIFSGKRQDAGGPILSAAEKAEVDRQEDEKVKSVPRPSAHQRQAEEKSTTSSSN